MSSWWWGAGVTASEAWAGHSSYCRVLGSDGTSQLGPERLSFRGAARRPGDDVAMTGVIRWSK